MNDEKTGSCLCEGVSFTITGPLRAITYCYCSQCRKTHGVMGPYTRAAHSDIHFTSDNTLKWYKSSGHAERGFCDTCGASIFWRIIGDDSSGISVGTLDQPSGLTADAHIFTDDLPDFYPLPEDGLPRIAGSSASELDEDDWV